MVLCVQKKHFGPKIQKETSVSRQKKKNHIVFIQYSTTDKHIYALYNS